MHAEKAHHPLFHFLTTTPLGFISVDHYGNILYTSIYCTQVPGAAGKNLWDCFKGYKEPHFCSELRRSAARRQSVHIEEYYEPLDLWVEMTTLANPWGLSIYFKNISEAKRQQEKQQKNEERLEQAENELHHVLESMTDGFYTVDRNWNILFATDKVAAMLGVNKEDYLGKNLWDCFPETVSSRVYTEYHRAFAVNKPVSFEEYLASFNMWFDINAYPHGDVLSVYVKDITERKNNEKRLEFIARATSEVIWEVDIHSGKVIINEEKFNAVFGYQLTGNCCHYSFWLDKVHPDDVAAILEKKQQALEQRLDYHTYEYRLKKSNDTWAYVKSRIYMVKDIQNKPLKLIGALEDITRERIAEKALMESEQTYRQLFDHASLPKAVYDRDTLQILNVNQAALDHYGYSREELLQMTILDIRPIEDQAKILDALSKASTSSRKNVGVWTHIKKSGERMLAEVSVATINYKGRICNLATVQDVTEKIKLQEQLTREKVERQQSITKATLAAQEKERTQIGRELHDGVNQVLTTAKLYVENIKYYPEQKEVFIDKSVSLLQNSIHEIRMLSKALVTPGITDIGFTDALLELIKSYQELNLFEIEHIVCPGIEKTENEVKLTVYRIIQEQLNNIVKYAKASSVRVQVVLRDQQLHLFIEDNGIGFEPTQKKNGLGLSNIKNRAELFQGKAKIESAPNGGCTIKVVFPV
jgi:PAS domain S-box-containing protein